MGRVLWKVGFSLQSIALFCFGLASAEQPVFTPPVNLGPKINTPANESDPFWDGSRKRLYFVRDFNIWFAQWTGTNWADPIELGPQINTGAGIEQSPSISPDGQRLYFVEDVRQGYLWDIWVSAWNSSINDWGTPVNLGYPVNTPGVEFSAHLAPDGVHLYFASSNDPDSLFPFGRCGIYASEWSGSSWSVPKLQWGCGQDPQYPSVPADGRWLYFNDYDSVGKSIFVSAWGGSGWVLPAYNLSQQLGGRIAHPFITPSGDSLFFTGIIDFGGFGGGDIYLSKRFGPLKASSLSDGSLILLVLLLTGAGIYWTLKQTP